MITKQEVQHIAKLAGLNLTEKELVKYQKEFLKVLDYVGRLKKVKTEKVDQITHSSFSFNIIREDEVQKFEKKLIDGHLKVKPIL